MSKKCSFGPHFQLRVEKQSNNQTCDTVLKTDRFRFYKNQLTLDETVMLNEIWPVVGEGGCGGGGGGGGSVFVMVKKLSMT